MFFWDDPIAGGDWPKLEIRGRLAQGRHHWIPTIVSTQPSDSNQMMDFTFLSLFSLFVYRCFQIYRGWGRS